MAKNSARPGFNKKIFTPLHLWLEMLYGEKCSAATKESLKNLDLELKNLKEKLDLTTASHDRNDK